MSSNSLRAAAARISGGTVPRSAFGRFGATRGAVVAAAGGRSLSATPVPGAQGVGMEQQDAVHGETRDGTHKGHWDPITHSFGEGYATRADEEGFGTVYARGDDEERPGHPEYDTSQGSEAREKEKGRHPKDDKHAA